jgi:hypothetical protein
MDFQSAQVIFILLGGISGHEGLPDLWVGLRFRSRTAGIPCADKRSLRFGGTASCLGALAVLVARQRVKVKFQASG